MALLQDRNLDNQAGASLVFPDDLQDTKNFYPEAIRFSVYERQAIDLERTSNDVTASLNGGAGSKRELTPEEIRKRTLGISQEVSGSVDLTQPIKQRNEQENAFETTENQSTLGSDQKTEQNKERGAVGLVSSIRSQLSAPTPASLAKRHLRSIYLAMPQALIYNEQIDWQGSDLGLVGGALQGSFGEGLKSGALSQAGTMLGGAAGVGIAKLFKGGGMAGGILGSILGGDSQFGSGIESVFGVKGNPYKEQTFQGVGFRPFEFAFTFRPRNDKEVDTVRSIIETFRAYSKPKFRNGKSGFFEYPKEFLIEFLVKEKDSRGSDSYKRNTYLPEIKFCICKNVGTNYTGQGWRTLNNGAPVDITLTLSFEETEIITEDDVFGKTSVGDFKNLGGNF